MSADRRGLYPPLEPYETGRLPVTERHTIYYECCGRPDGEPAVLLHGGPGGGANPTMRRFHDPSHYRAVLFDQRGCGRSEPHAELAENTTWDLVADIERLREHLGIERWQVFGGSWGACLALAYAETHPERVTALMLRGIFTLRRRELAWFYQEGAGLVFPERFAPYRDFIPEAERQDMIAAYHARLTGADAELRLEAARRWSMWEGSALSLLPDPARVAAFGDPGYALAFARIEAHYFINRGFFRQDDQILADAHRLAGIPGVIVHGRYDMCTPVFIAYDLAAVWPEATLQVIEDAGHAMTEPGIVDALVRATDRFRGSSAGA